MRTLDSIAQPKILPVTTVTRPVTSNWTVGPKEEVKRDRDQLVKDVEDLLMPQSQPLMLQQSLHHHQQTLHSHLPPPHHMDSETLI
jgi:hypothetical protein